MHTLDLQYLFIVYVHRNSSAYVMLFVGVFASISLAHFFPPRALVAVQGYMSASSNWQWQGAALWSRLRLLAILIVLISRAIELDENPGWRKDGAAVWRASEEDLFNCHEGFSHELFHLCLCLGKQQTPAQGQAKWGSNSALIFG